MRQLLSLAGAAACLAAATACSPATGTPPAPPADASDSPPPRALLAAHAAAAKDFVGVLAYRLVTEGRPDRTVTVVRAADGDWRVDVPGGALGGGADIAVVGHGGELFHCVVGLGPHCVRVSELSAEFDPMAQHVFTDWLEVLTERTAPLAISEAEPLDGVAGTCFSVESSTASLVAPVDPGIYCFGADGVLTGARLSFGTLTLAGDPRPAPDSVELPGPVVDGTPLPTASPDPPPSTQPPTAG